MKKHSLLESENLKALGDMYESFLDENDMRESNMLMLFLADIRSEQLKYKKLEDRRAKATGMELIKLTPLRYFSAASSAGLCIDNSTILDWYEESRIDGRVYVSETAKAALNQAIDEKIKQNELEKVRMWEAAKDKIVR